MLEILAPAGNEESALAAIKNGADALYLGFSAFSARMSAENFDIEQLSALVKKARFSGLKVYVAMNTLVTDDEVEDFLSTLLQIWSIGVDAVIMQDIFLGKYVHQIYPEILLHLSTQAGVCNQEGAIFAKECGFSRVILARETPIEEIEKIAAVIETEVFVQGALCSCFSGQCYLSSFAGGNSGNRGRCKQPCRKTYSYDREGYDEKAYALSPSDLCVGEDVEKLIKAGVTSFKIEGRMRRSEYVAAAVRYYRAILDGMEEKERKARLSHLKRTFNRGNYTKGLAFGQDKRFLSRAVQGHIGEKVGFVKVQSGQYTVESAFPARQGDAFKILREGKEVGGAVYAKSALRGFTISSKTRLLNGDGVFVTTDSALAEQLLKGECDRYKQKISLTLRFRVGEPAYAEGGGVSVSSEELLSEASTSALTADEVKNCFLKTDGLPVEIQFAKICLDGNVFMAKSRLNALRRAYFEALYAARTRVERPTFALASFPRYLPSGRNGKNAVIASDFDGLQGVDIAIYKPDDYRLPLPQSFQKGGFEKYVYYPAFATSAELTAIETLCAQGVDGIYAENYGGVRFAQRLGIKLFAGTGFNLTNGVSLAQLLSFSCVSYYAPSKELDGEKADALLGEQAFSLSGGIKVMDLIYCPFERTCAACDKKSHYTLTDEQGRQFPVRRYVGGEGGCRFEIYNCAHLLGKNGSGGVLLDLTPFREKAERQAAVLAADNRDAQKKVYQKYTFGHTKTNKLL